MDPTERSFTVEASSIGEVGGRYINDEPRNAAMKAARVLFGSAGSQKKLKLQLRETTRGSKDKLYAYEAEKIRINKTVTIAGKEVQINQKIKLSKTPLFHGDGVNQK